MFQKTAWAVLCLLALGCASKATKTEAKVDSEPSARAPSRAVSATGDKPVSPAGDAVLEKKSLMGGQHFAFGLQMPRGMIPTSTNSPSVYRFEGTHPVSQVTRFISKQLVGAPRGVETQFSGGVLFSGVTVLDHAKAGENPTVINIKVFDGSLGGAAVDVWKGPSGQATKKNGTAQTLAAIGAVKHHSSSGDEAPEKPKTRRERIKATFRAIEHQAAGKAPTADDLASPYYTED